MLRSKFNQAFTIIINLTSEINRSTQRRSTTFDNVRSSKFLDKSMHESRVESNLNEH